jgi:DNA repair exonuclease SbcCD ATPase subunit
MPSLEMIITLAIVAVALVAYRQVDKNNRSLEKIKKFADKTLDDIARFVDEKAAGIRDYSIDLDVQQKAAKVLLERVQTSAESIEGKAEAIDRINERVAAYDKAMDELMAMTERAQENLRRLNEESRYIEKSLAEVGTVRSQLDKIRDEVPALRDAMASDCRAALAEYRDGMLKSVREEISAQEGRLEKGAERIAQFERFATELEKRREAKVKTEFEQIDKELAAALDRAAADAEKLEGAAFAKLKDGILGRAAKLQDALEERQEQIREAAKEKIQETQGLLKGFRAEWAKESDSLLRDLKAEVGGLADSAGARFDLIQASADKFGEEQDGRLAKVAQRVDSFIAESKSNVAFLEKEISQRVAAAEAASKDSIARVAAFSADLEGRVRAETGKFEASFNAEFERRLESFREGVDAKFTALEEANADLSQLDAALRGSMAKIEKNLEADFEDFSASLAEKQRAGQARLEEDMGILQKTMGEIEAQLNELKGKAYSNVSEKLKVFEDEFFVDLQKRSAQINERLAAWKQDLDSQLGAIASSQEAARVEIEKRYGEQLKARISEYGARVKEQIDKISEAVREHRTSSQETIKLISQEFAAQKKDIVQASQEDRKALKQDLIEAGKRVDELKLEIDDKSKAALDSFTKSYESLHQDVARRNREFLVEFDTKSRGLSDELEDIDKRQKAYLTQTKLFERSDELKTQLGKDIEALKEQLAKVSGQKQELTGLEAEFARIKKLEEEANAKLERFLGEKRRLESMEDDFKRLIDMSKTIEERVRDLSANDDRLSQMQVQMRGFLDLSKDVDSKYDKLDKKRPMLEAAQEGVDKNFQSLQALEKGFRAMEDQFKGLSPKVGAIANDVDALMRQRDEVRAVLGKAESLSSVLGDLETRMEALSKARDWLARTETRLEEVSRDAQEQVKLLETLVKAESKVGKGERGAPPVNVRDTVTKLARQGWSVEEIARVTKLSRGEIELILEVSPRK